MLNVRQVQCRVVTTTVVSIRAFSGQCKDLWLVGIVSVHLTCCCLVVCTTHIHVHIWTQIQTHIHVHIWTQIQTHIHVHIWTQIQTHIHVHINSFQCNWHRCSIPQNPLSAAKLRNNLGQVVHTYVSLSTSSITWYRPMGGDALWLGR